MHSQPITKGRFQFSIRVLLLMMAIPAGALGVVAYFRRPVNRRITMEQVSRIKPGMSERQVIAILGAPLHRFEGAPLLRWTLDDDSMRSFAIREISFLDITFDEQRKVKQIDEVGNSRLRIFRIAPPQSMPNKPVR